MPDNPSGFLQSSIGIAALRWQVSLYRRDQTPATTSAGISENFVLIATVRADVQPTYPTTYYNSAQVDIPITHLIRVPASLVNSSAPRVCGRSWPLASERFVSRSHDREVLRA